MPMMHAIIDLLEFPRRLLRDDVDLEDCPHAGHFAPSDRACRVCEARAECEWLYHNDACVALAAKPLDAALDALDAAILYVDARATRAGHARHGCGCEACIWLRKARKARETRRAEEC